MKKSMKAIMVLCLLVIWGCTTDEGNFVEKEVKQNITKSIGNVPVPEIIKNEVVIQYLDIKIAEGKKKELRKFYENQYQFKIDDIKKCDCNSDNLELWSITPLPGFIGLEGEEGLTGNINHKEPSGVVEANYNFYFKVQNQSLENKYSSRISEKIKSNNSKDFVNIAILDTGIDYDFFPDRFLYNSSNTSTCQDEISGWDYVNNDYDPRDDHGHGTTVAKIITKQLDTYNTPYSILAVKTFNQDGIGSYWANVCGINYLAKKQDNFIVNTSFGFYGITEQDIFKNIVDSANDRLLIVSSAGNLGVDTDISGNEHFPSGYDSSNILTVGGYTKGEFFTSPMHGSPYVGGLLKANGSNYGNSSIDALASYDEHDIILVDTKKLNDTIKYSVAGTSFAAAEVTARAARLFKQTSGAPLAIKNKTLESGFIVRGLNGYINKGKVIIRNLMNSGGRPTPTHHNGNGTNAPITH